MSLKFLLMIFFRVFFRVPSFVCSFRTNKCFTAVHLGCWSPTQAQLQRFDECLAAIGDEAMRAPRIFCDMLAFSAVADEQVALTLERIHKFCSETFPKKMDVAIVNQKKYRS